MFKPISYEWDFTQAGIKPDYYTNLSSRIRI